VTQVTRATYDDALLRAREVAFAPGEFVGQESFMSQGEIMSLARRAGIGPGVSVLDLCCGVAGPGRLVTSELGCSYLGIDRDEHAVAIARARSSGLGCRFEVGEVPPLPSGPFGVVLLLETLLAFPDKDALLRTVSSALVPGGRFALTVEEGLPLSEIERDEMPAADTVWPIPLAELVLDLARVGLCVSWMSESTRAHQLVADALLTSYESERAAIAAQVGEDVVGDLLTAHRLWGTWLSTGRIRKFALVAERID
jgi:sarcosine/dimethylglycine N-methyltransferase